MHAFSTSTLCGQLQAPASFPTVLSGWGLTLETFTEGTERNMINIHLYPENRGSISPRNVPISPLD
jgi:hypothetical protein